MASLAGSLPNKWMKLSFGTIVAIIVSLLFHFGGFDAFERVTFDTAFKLRGTRATDPRIVLVDMADDSVRAIGRWPWPREWHATIITVLSRLKVQGIFFDVLFDQASEKQGDLILEEAIKQSGIVSLPFVFDIERKKAASGEEKNRQIIHTVREPMPQFAKGTDRLGHINIFPDPDGIIRRIPLFIEHEGILHPQLSLQAALAVWDIPADAAIVKKGEYVEIPGTPHGTVRIPIDEDYQMLINWAGPWAETFTHYSFFDVIAAFQEQQEGASPRIPLQELEGKLCLIGLASTGLSDLKSVPHEANYPGVGVHANAINNILQNRFLKEPPPWVNFLIIVFASLFMSTIMMRLSPIQSVMVLVAGIIGYLAGTAIIFNTLGIRLCVIPPPVSGTLSFLLITAYSEAVVALESKRLFTLATRDGLTGLYNIRYFKALLDAELIQAKKREVKVAVIMADIDHFKQFNDTYGHQTGDFVLREVAKIFKGCARQLDIAARYGGEEMVMMLPNADGNGHDASKCRHKKCGPSCRENSKRR